MSKTATVVALGKGERTAARIREVALDQFSRLGFERVTLAGIAEAAEVSQPTLHYHFRDKDHLWRSAMLELAAVISDEERLLKAARDAPPLTQLRMAMRMFLEVSWRHPALGRIIALEGMAGGRAPGLAEREPDRRAQPPPGGVGAARHGGRRAEAVSA